MVDDKGSPDKGFRIFDKGQEVEQALGAEPFDVVQDHAFNVVNIAHGE